MATLSVNALQASVAQAERQVQQDRVRVNQDTSRLDASRDQLARDKQKLADNQRDSDQATQAAEKPLPTVNLSRAIENPPRAQQVLPADLTAPKPQVNTLGQTIGKFINVTA
ncbi:MULTISPECIES: hypothetical protein [unclassified Duganella]|jgi:capsule polysaccharide export protein KpsE/RkpR|uniref:hypothetical protein n=1 Tax=unclassified Duganella TaxID=2636909 RepID=UPI0008847304|nr:MULTISPECIES: hypothetical protein [unclassified Duganella]SDG94309.1 hypothetical protein SAMN05216320_108186 [Duganella sp. OV458]SDJ48050.1 hypothetical protein SAMN05428973_104261 [Duganella sp. OV510]